MTPEKELHVRRMLAHQSRAADMDATCVWICGEVPEIGAANLQVTYSATQAELWRTRGLKVTQFFKFVRRTP